MAAWMMFLAWIVVFVSIKGSFVLSSNQDPCKSDQILPGASTRLTSLSGSAHCDNKISKAWYRLSNSNHSAKMPEGCVATNRCGTRAPGWLNGQHPTAAEGIVRRKVCFHWANNCCRWYAWINVKNCGGFFVYELVRLGVCSLRYCIAASGPCHSYKIVPDKSTRLTSITSGAFCDGTLTKAWYRLSSSDHAGKMPENCVPGNRCGTRAPGWLNGQHPTPAEGEVRRKVCFHSSSNCCRWHTWINVKNCGAFFVYELDKTPSCNLRYCAEPPVIINGGWGSWSNYSFCKTCDGGTKYRRRLCNNPYPQNGGKPCAGSASQSGKCQTQKCPVVIHGDSWPWLKYGPCSKTCGGGISRAVKRLCLPGIFGDGKRCSNVLLGIANCNEQMCPVTNPCESHQIIPDASSRLTSLGRGASCDNGIIKGWYRLSNSGHSAKMPEGCVPANRCGTRYPGWLNGHHPTAAEGIVRRKVCFRWQNDCCKSHTWISVRNCGRFFVYELHKPPSCPQRYCVAAPGPCHSYKIIPGKSTRLTSITSRAYCDGSLKKAWYRLSSSDHSGEMPKNCVPANRCGAHAPGWLNGQHPTAAEGIVRRKVCFHWQNDCCKWHTWINVKNCGAFFVYELDRTPNCHLRYCVKAPDLSLVCGVSDRKKPIARIVGGTDASIQKWPWQAGLKKVDKKRIFCGGSLIDNHWILTAAHCIRTFNGGRRGCTVPTTGLRVILGEFDVNNSEGHEVHIDVAQVCMHSDYDITTLDYDIALLQLKTPIAEFNSTMRPVCLPNESTNFAAGTNCTVTGFGRTSEGIRTTSNKLQQVDVPIKPLDYCKKQYPSRTVTERMICAGHEEGKKDSCQGDSGGPLVCQNGSRYVLWGAVSWGIGCARAGQPGVYTNIKFFLPWIENTMQNPNGE